MAPVNKQMLHRELCPTCADTLLVRKRRRPSSTETDQWNQFLEQLLWTVGLMHVWLTSFEVLIAQCFPVSRISSRQAYVRVLENLQREPGTCRANEAAKSHSAPWEECSTNGLSLPIPEDVVALPFQGVTTASQLRHWPAESSNESDSKAISECDCQ